MIATSEKGIVNILVYSSSDYAVFLTYDTGSNISNNDYSPRIYNKTRFGFDAYLMRNPKKTYYLTIGF